MIARLLKAFPASLWDWMSDDDHARLLAQLEPVQVELCDFARAGDWPESLSLAVRAHQNLVVSGATDSGKTSFIRALSS